MTNFKKAEIFRKYLKLADSKPWTFFLACLFPFLQAFISSIMIIYTDPSRNTLSDNLMLGLTGAIFYTCFIANSKRSSSGSSLGLFLLVLFGSLGLVAGKLMCV